MIIFIYTHKNRKKHLQKHGDILKSQNDNKSEQTFIPLLPHVFIEHFKGQGHSPKYFGKQKGEIELVRDRLFKRKGFFL